MLDTHHFITGIIAAFAFQRMQGSRLFGDSQALQKYGPFLVAGAVVVLGHKLIPSVVA